MQVLKDNIRLKIKLAAKNAFVENGFKNVTMRKIASDSDMTVGNIYRYYKNKEELFEDILMPSLKAILELANNNIMDSVFQPIDHISKMIDLFLNIHNKYEDELFILVNGCEGSSIDTPINSVVKIISSNVKSIISNFTNVKSEEVDVDFMSKIVSESIVESYIKILYNFSNDKDRRSHMLSYIRVYIGWNFDEGVIKNV